jgi:hypothetical protein
MSLTRRRLLHTGTLTALGLALPAGVVTWPSPARASGRRLAPNWRGLDASGGRTLVLAQAAVCGIEFAGTYRSPQLGALQLWHAEDGIQGRYGFVREGVRVSGALDGALEDNLLQLTWRETHHTRDGEQRHHGDGYFLYQPSAVGEPRTRLFGARQHIVLAETVRHNVYDFDRRSAGPMTAIKLAAPAG